MNIPDVRKIEVPDEQTAALARVTFESNISPRQEKYLRGLLGAFYKTKREFSFLCIEVVGTVILFRTKMKPPYRPPTPEEMYEVLNAMDLQVEPPPAPRRRNRSRFSPARSQAELRV
ncbi:MAG: hypothetical protein Q8O53_03320 [Candidatus Moranbacteria bacterium]|nr:hypothetical protein [Candidatus Moranbacteria bacterium]